MKENPESVLFKKNTEREQLKEENLEKYEANLRKLLEEYKKVKRSGEKEPDWTETVNFDISDPRSEDIKNFSSGEFEISNLAVLEKDGKIISFRFYIGGTEFIVSRKAIDKYYELLENN